MTWDPAQYQRFGDERSRPFFELVDRIPATNPKIIVDLGCGPGPLTAALGQRWPAAKVLGVDNDRAMITSAEQHATENVRFELGDIGTWSPAAPVDVIVANAAFQWVPGHRENLTNWLDMLSPGGTLAFQVPGNLDDPHHQLIRSLRASSRWHNRGRLAQLPERTHDSFRALDYLATLGPLAATVDAWETTYVHILSGHDPVLEWVKGTALRPVLAALDSDSERAEFCDELAPMLRQAYPTEPWGTPFPFRRVFVVATTHR
jgi:trans-aconitate 2-methyltransferase